jgi:hypothetical protein
LNKTYSYFLNNFFILIKICFFVSISLSISNLLILDLYL